MKLKDTTHQYISDDMEKDVWFYSNKFGLNRLRFRIIMSIPQVANSIHKLNYDEASAAVLLGVLQENKEQIPKGVYYDCARRLRKIIESESVSDFYTES